MLRYLFSLLLIVPFGMGQQPSSSATDAVGWMYVSVLDQQSSEVPVFSVKTKKGLADIKEVRHIGDAPHNYLLLVDTSRSMRSASTWIQDLCIRFAEQMVG